MSAGRPYPVTSLLATVLLAQTGVLPPPDAPTERELRDATRDRLERGEVIRLVGVGGRTVRGLGRSAISIREDGTVSLINNVARRTFTLPFGELDILRRALDTFDPSRLRPTRRRRPSEHDGTDFTVLYRRGRRTEKLEAWRYLESELPIVPLLNSLWSR